MIPLKLIYRIDPTREPGQERLDAGNYFHELVKIDGHWKIKGIKQTVAIMNGNPLHGALRDIP